MLAHPVRLSTCARTCFITQKRLIKPFSSSSVARSQLENVLEGGPVQPVQVNKVSPTGIELADGLVITSSCIFLGGKVFLWKVPPTLWNGWDKERFELFEVAVPKPGASCTSKSSHLQHSIELLLFGTGESTVAPPTAIRQYLHKLGIGLEIMDTVSTETT
jgi:NADH dehydrogenase [ubiquinone] 1 alpha subcomplex assembly factor 3